MSSVSNDGFTIRWTAPTAGTFTKFQVTVEDGISIVKTEKPAKQTTSVFPGLEAGKDYTVTVVTVFGLDAEDARKSTPLTKTFATSTYLLILYMVYRKLKHCV